MRQTRSAKRPKEAEKEDVRKKKKGNDEDEAVSTGKEETNTRKRSRVKQDSKQQKKPKTESLQRPKRTTTGKARSQNSKPEPKSKKRKATEPPEVEKVPKEQDVLKAFDLTIQFGGCLGISRLDRWNRAKRFHLEPPRAVFDILSEIPTDHEIQRCVWESQI